MNIMRNPKRIEDNSIIIEHVTEGGRNSLRFHNLPKTSAEKALDNFIHANGVRLVEWFNIPYRRTTPCT